MCIAIPSQVVEIVDSTATVERFGEQLSVSLMLLPEPVELGDYVIVQARSFAIEKIPAEEAEKSLELFREWLGAEDSEAGEVETPVGGLPSSGGASNA
jgi:hydrogenase expression/formation protein HypC